MSWWGYCREKGVGCRPSSTPRAERQGPATGTPGCRLPLPCLSVHRIYTGTTSQQHQLSLQGKCADISISILTSGSPAMSPRTSLEHHWGEKSAHSHPIVWCLCPSAAVCELSHASGWIKPGISYPCSMSSKWMPNKLPSRLSPPNFSLENI